MMIDDDTFKTFHFGFTGLPRLEHTFLQARCPSCCPTNQGSEKPRLFKKPNPLGFGGFIGFWALFIYLLI